MLSKAARAQVPAGGKLFYELWFPRITQNIAIVAPPSSDGLADAELTSANYALLDRLGDRDTIYTVGKLFSRRYPNAVIHLASADDFTRPNFSQNFAIIGGPGGVVPSARGAVDPMIGNRICRHFSERLGSRFSYSADCESLAVGREIYRASVNSLGHMTKDYGVFTAFVNPYLRSTRVVMLHGIHTLGVLGAARLLDGEIDSKENFDVLESAATTDPSILGTGFECFFEVNISFGEVECPRLEPAQIFPIGGHVGGDYGRSGADRQSPPESILSPGELLSEVLSILRVARQQTLPANAAALDDLLNRMGRMQSPTLEVIQRILEVCRRNSRLPMRSVKEIAEILDDNRVT